MILKKLVIALFLSLFLIDSIKSQSLDINVQGEIYEYATYYISSFDVATGATNVQIFNYSLESNMYPVFVKVRFQATMISPGLNINSEVTIIDVETEPFMIYNAIYIDNRDINSETSTISDNSGNQIMLKGVLNESLDPTISESIVQTILMSGKIADGQYTFNVSVFGGLDENNLSNIFNDTKTFVIQTQVPVSLEYPGGALSDTTDNLLYTSFPIFQWSSGPPLASAQTFIRVAQFDPSSHSSLEDAIQDQRVLPANQSEEWELIENVNSYQYPFSGSYPLDPGNIYCWQVKVSLPTTAGYEDMLSPIYAFKIGQAGTIETTNIVSNPLLMMIQQTLPEQFENYFGPGKELEGFLPSGQIEINGVTVGPSVVNSLLQQFSNQEYQIQSVVVE